VRTKSKTTAAALRVAAAAAEKLEAEGIQIQSHYSNGRQAVLVADRKPAFVRGVLTRREPTGSGVTHVYASPFHGVQLEWHDHVPAVREVGHA
jgi:hypothetical protein